MKDSMDREKIMQCVELLCERGCRVVRAAIAALERGEEVVETLPLDHDERQAVLRELQSIMAVYGDECRL